MADQEQNSYPMPPDRAGRESPLADTQPDERACERDDPPGRLAMTTLDTMAATIDGRPPTIEALRHSSIVVRLTQKQAKVAILAQRFVTCSQTTQIGGWLAQECRSFCMPSTHHNQLQSVWQLNIGSR
jgi:hypothetical protein